MKDDGGKLFGGLGQAFGIGVGAAGAVEAIFTALAVKEDFVPATVNYKVPDEECDLDVVPNEGRNARVRAAVSNTLGFGGHNATILIKKYEK